MISHQVYHIEFLTPCFCAGADQEKAELRGSSIRGQLRWWFRALGGSKADERDVFGGVHDTSAAASSLLVRVLTDSGGGQKDWFVESMIPRKGFGNKAYLLGFFCGEKRLQSDGALPPGRKAEVRLTFLRPPTPLLELAIRVFFSIGALGYRSNRAAGAFASNEHSLTDENFRMLKEELMKRDFDLELLPEVFSDWVQLCDRAGDILKNCLRSKNGLGIGAGKNKRRANALGSALPRQGSVVHFRPVRIDGRLRLALIEAPHARILGCDAQTAHGARGPILQTARLTCAGLAH